MAAIYDETTGDVLTEGLPGSQTCTLALQTAERIAARLGRAVHLEDDDGDWIVGPDGSCRTAPVGPALVITHGHAYHGDGWTVSLCRRHHHDDTRFGPLGQVQHAWHEGSCDECSADEYCQACDAGYGEAPSGAPCTCREVRP